MLDNIYIFIIFNIIIIIIFIYFMLLNNPFNDICFSSIRKILKKKINWRNKLITHTTKIINYFKIFCISSSFHLFVYLDKSFHCLLLFSFLIQSLQSVFSSWYILPNDISCLLITINTTIILLVSLLKIQSEINTAIPLEYES